MTVEKVSVVQEPGPSEMRDPVVRAEFKRARVWFGMAIAIALVVLLIHPLLIIFGGLVFAALLDGGVRLLGKVLPLPRPIRLLLVILMMFLFVGYVFYSIGVEIVAQAEQLGDILQAQAERVFGWASTLGLVPHQIDFMGLAQQALGSIGPLTSAVGSVVGAAGTFLMIFIIGLFVASEPRIYERGLQWMVPIHARPDFAVTIARMAITMRRLLAGRLVGMAFEGVFTGLLLWLVGVPMAMLLGLITGMLAFIPNIGAITSGVLMVAAGFSVGTAEGFWAIAIYFGVQNFDAYVVIPTVAKRTVDMPPALTLSSQVLASALFGVLGLALADPLVAMVKVLLERESEIGAREGMLEPASGETISVDVPDPAESASPG